MGLVESVPWFPRQSNTKTNSALYHGVMWARSKDKASRRKDARVTVSKYLSIYVNDHLAALTALRDVAGRAARSNGGTGLGTYLHEVASDLEDSRIELRRVATDLGVRRDPLKQAAAWAAEKLGRLKLNGHLLSHSPLSRVLELEGLAAGAELEIATWRTLSGATGRDFSDRIGKCEARRDELARRHAEAVAALFGEGSSPTPS
jgi:hypothetical protein